MLPSHVAPTLTSGNTGVNLGASCLKCCPDHLWVLEHFPDFDLQSLFCDQQIHCGLRQSVPDQFGCYENWGDNRGSSVCPSSPMAYMSGTIWSAAGAVTLPCSCQGSHQPGYLVSQLRGIPSTGLVVTVDLACTLSWVSSFLVSALWAVTISWEYMYSPGLL